MLGDSWIIRDGDPAASSRLAREMGICPLTAKTLVSRGYDTAEKASAFLSGSTLSLYDPFLMKDMDKAVFAIGQAVLSGKRICIYGDYDVDGVTATTLLFTYLTSKGARCTCFIPERLSEGYGLNSQAVRALAPGCDLIITVDTGITAVDEVEYARSLGVDVVITDHHSCRDVLPEASAVVNPHRPDCPYPFKSLAGVGVVFKLVCALEGDSDRILAEYADIAAIGTVADVMPLIDENRLIVGHGLKMLENTSRKGLLALMRQSGVFRERSKKRITASTIGFTIAPRLNAAGRISSATKALELLLASDDETAERIACELCEINKIRQQTELKIYSEATMQISEYGRDSYSYVLSSDTWHQGVIGVVASKISEKYQVPCILFSFDGDIGKGSGRSVKGFSLMDALSVCSDLLIEYGGHELAAGLSIERAKLPEFRKRFEEYAKRILEGGSTSAPVEIDCGIGFDEISVKNALELMNLEPFGLGNPVPLFILKNAVITDISPISEDKHIRLRVKEKDGVRELNCVYFGMSHSEFPFCRGDVCEIACSLEINEYNGAQIPCVLVRAVRPCEAERSAIYASRTYYAHAYDESVELPTSVLPTLDDFRLVFRVLKREIGNDRKRVSVRYIKRKIELTEGEKTNLCALKIVLDVLSEFGLVDCIKVRSNDIVELKLLPYSQKIDLEKSAILRRVRDNIEHSPH